MSSPPPSGLSSLPGSPDGFYHAAHHQSFVEIQDLNLKDLAGEVRLMLVDDNARARSAVAACVSTLDGIRVIDQACNGLEAIEKVQGQNPDIVLMDVRMPHMDGIEATRILKNRWPWIKVVILTIYPGCQVEAESAGADACLLKGCCLQELTSTIRSVAGL